MEIIRAERVSYDYRSKYQTTQALSDVSCTFETGLMYSIIGKSGSGKSTFLSLLAGMELPTSGRILVEDKDMSLINRDEYRMKKVSIVYQAFHLFPLLTAVENVMFPMELQGKNRRKAKKEAEALLLSVGLTEETFQKYPAMLSGGQQQRCAIARAMSSEGQILLADEPTGNLDSENEKMIIDLMKKMAQEEKKAVIIVTHNEIVADASDVVLRMQDGRLFEVRAK
ncbi:MAG: ABC transporter ATP-binding protein [Lachnospiraceae bacterium]|nr:ABC transporter ATP-binding protein [Lachnospiraceae bacterium]